MEQQRGERRPNDSAREHGGQFGGEAMELARLQGLEGQLTWSVLQASSVTSPGGSCWLRRMFFFSGGARALATRWSKRQAVVSWASRGAPPTKVIPHEESGRDLREGPPLSGPQFPPFLMGRETECLRVLLCLPAHEFKLKKPTISQVTDEQGEVLISQRAVLGHDLQGPNGTWATGTVGHDPVDLVGVGAVQLVALAHLPEVSTLVEGTAEPGLPGGGVFLINAL